MSITDFSPMDKSDVSVVIGTYNGAKFIVQQLESIVAQSVAPTEIIVADDQSTDDTLAIVSEFARSCWIPINVKRNERNLGFPENFIQAALSSTGTYIAFCDQDDVWRCDKIELSLRALRKNKAIMAVHSADLIDEKGISIGRMRPFRGTRVARPRTLDPWTIFWGFSQMFDRKLLHFLPNDQDSRGVDNNAPHRPAGHDQWTSFVAATFGSIVMIDQPLVRYRQHGRNVYGFRQRSLMNKIVSKLSEEQSRQGRICWQMDIATHRAAILRKNSDQSAEYVLAVEYWSDIAASCAARLKLARSASLRERCSLLIQNIVHHVYSRRTNGNAWARRLLEDALMGVVGITLKKK